MLAFVLLFAVAFSAEVTCDPKLGQKVNTAGNGCECDSEKGFTVNTGEDKDTKPCVCSTANNYIINKTGATNTLAYACEACTGETNKYDPTNFVCVKDCPSKTQADNGVCKACTGTTALYNQYTKTCVETCPTFAPATDSVCTCPQGQTYDIQSSSCKASTPACNLPGQKVNGNACECDTEKGFTVNTGEDKDTKPCVCNTGYHEETSGTPAVTSCVADAVCTLPGQKLKDDKKSCECTVTGFTDNAGSDKDTKPCVCDTANGYENTAKEGEPMKCEKKAEPTEEEKCKGVKGQEWKDNQCVCDTANGFENKETEKEKPINCGCKEAGHNIIKETKDNTTSYKCAKCDDKEKYDENEMKCIKSGVNGLFLLLAMALFFLF